MGHPVRSVQDGPIPFASNIGIPSSSLPKGTRIEPDTGAIAHSKEWRVGTGMKTSSIRKVQPEKETMAETLKRLKEQAKPTYLRKKEKRPNIVFEK